MKKTMKKTVFAFVLLAALVLSLAACGSAPAAGQSAESSAAPAEEDGQNPVMNFVGVYSAENSREALVEADGQENAKITLTCADSPWFHTQTVMSGRFDPETLTMGFSSAQLTEFIYNSDGSVAQETVSETGGKGRAVFNPADNTLTITEESDTGDIETVYAWGSSPEMKFVGDPDYYSPVTATDKAEIETVIAFNVRRAYLSEDWFALADLIRYPITINETELADADAFLGYMMDKTVCEGDREVMLEEDCLDMFINGEGICMGSGQVWLNDLNYMTDKEPNLQIIAISGIVDR